MYLMKTKLVKMCTTNQSATISDDHDDPLTSEQKRVSYGKNTVDPEKQHILHQYQLHRHYNYVQAQSNRKVVGLDGRGTMWKTFTPRFEVYIQILSVVRFLQQNHFG